MKTKEQLKAEYRAIKAERELWRDYKPTLRHNNPTQYRLKSREWQGTFDALTDMMNICVLEAKV